MLATRRITVRRSAALVCTRSARRAFSHSSPQYHSAVLAQETVPREVATEDWHRAKSAALLDPCDYIRSMPSKNVRGSLVAALNTWLHIPRKSQQLIEEIIQLLHDASLILDDIQDNSPIRRGKPAVHTIFGPSQAINSANFMFVRAVQTSRFLHNPHAAATLLEELENLYLGQGQDLAWKFQLHCPTRDEYLEMVDNKTGGMFRMLIRLMSGEAATKHGASLERLWFLMGRFFQVRDDYMNLKSGLYAEQKGTCEDLDEGKFSFPIVCCLEKEQYRNHLLSVFRQRPSGLEGVAQPLSLEMKRFILNCLERSGSLTQTLTFAKQLEDELNAEILRLEETIAVPNQMIHMLVESLSVSDLE